MSRVNARFRVCTQRKLESAWQYPSNSQQEVKTAQWWGRAGVKVGGKSEVGERCGEEEQRITAAP